VYVTSASASAQSNATVNVVQVFSTSATGAASVTIAANATLKWEGTTPQAEDWTLQVSTFEEWTPEASIGETWLPIEAQNEIWTTAGPSSGTWTRAA
jgi:hypothetical protein